MRLIAFMNNHGIPTNKAESAKCNLSVKETLAILQGTNPDEELASWLLEAPHGGDHLKHVWCTKVMEAVNWTLKTNLPATEFDMLAIRENAVRLGQPLSDRFGLKNLFGTWDFPDPPLYGLHPTDALNKMRHGITNAR